MTLPGRKVKLLAPCLCFMLIAGTGCAGTPGVDELKEPAARPAADRAEPEVLIPRVLTVERALELADNSPDIIASSRKIAAAQASLEQAGTAPNPKTSLSTESLSLKRFQWEDAVTKLHLSQEFELGGKRGARVELARKEKGLAEVEHTFLQVRRRMRVTLAFNGVLYAQEREKLLKAILKAATELHDVASAKLEGGKISRREFLQFDITLSDARLSHRNALAEIKPALAGLAAAIGTSPDRFVVEKCEGRLGALESSGNHDEFLGSVRASLLEANPEIAVALEKMKVTQGALAHERARRWPNLTAGLMFVRVEPRYDNAVGASLGLPIPIWDSNRKAVKAASLRLEAAKKELEQVQNDAIARFEVIKEDLLTAARSADTYSREIIPKAQESHAIAVAAFEGGRLSYVETLEPLVSLLRAREAQLKWLRQFSDAAARLKAMLSPGDR